MSVLNTHGEVKTSYSRPWLLRLRSSPPDLVYRGRLETLQAGIEQFALEGSEEARGSGVVVALAAGRAGDDPATLHERGLKEAL